MADAECRIEGKIGRITLNRPQALNALTHEMCLEMEAALDAWATDDAVLMVLIDANGERAFCAGGDIADMYHAGKRGDFDHARRFWTDEYRLNAKIARFPKPYAALMHGFTMGGGVGVSGHGSHRIACEDTKIAMPECAIGLIPDVGGTLLLAQAPGRLGEYLGITGVRMNAADAIYAGFADYFVPQDAWPALIQTLVETGDWTEIDRAAQSATGGTLETLQPTIDAHFGGETLGDILRSLKTEETDFTADALKRIGHGSPLSAGCTIELIHRLHGSATIEKALELEYRYTYRSMDEGELIEGVRAAIIDKDRQPKWRVGVDDVNAMVVAKMLMPLGENALNISQPKPRIGFIGLGNMGAPMAANLAAAGYDVTGFDLVAACPAGVSTAASTAEAATGQDIIITMLPNGAILRSVAAEILPEMASGSVFIDCSTVDVESAQAVAEQAANVGVLAVDAPVSGGIGGASGGTLTFMAGGADAGFAAAAPLFDIMGQKAVHCGASGAGQAAKICNNMILGITMIGTCEAFALADKLGLDRQKMFDVVSTSSGASWSINTYCPAPGVGPQSPADNNYQPGFAADLMLKDLRLSQQAAEGADAATPLGQHATEIYQQFVEAEDGAGKDFSAMLPRFEKKGRET